MNPKESCDWRMHFIRLLEPPLLTGQPANKKIAEARQRISDARAAAVANICRQFLDSGVAQLLKEDMAESRLKKLEAIVLQASELAYSLWAQKRTLRIKRLFEHDKPFDSKDPSMEAHQLHNKLLEDDSSALDGKPILILAHPTVLSLGYADNSDTPVSTVLKAATCWMAEPTGWKRKLFGA